MVSYGGGANSTALLIGLHQHRIPVDLILFADTGAEHPHTYAYLEVMDRWLKDHGMPPITRVYKTTLKLAPCLVRLNTRPLHHIPDLCKPFFSVYASVMSFQFLYIYKSSRLKICPLP